MAHRGVLPGVEHDEVVAQAVHLLERHFPARHAHSCQDCPACHDCPACLPQQLPQITSPFCRACESAKRKSTCSRASLAVQIKLPKTRKHLFMSDILCTKKSLKYHQNSAHRKHSKFHICSTKNKQKSLDARHSFTPAADAPVRLFTTVPLSPLLSRLFAVQRHRGHAAAAPRIAPRASPGIGADCGRIARQTSDRWRRGALQMACASSVRAAQPTLKPQAPRARAALRTVSGSAQTHVCWRARARAQRPGSRLRRGRAITTRSTANGASIASFGLLAL